MEVDQEWGATVVAVGGMGGKGGGGDEKAPKTSCGLGITYDVAINWFLFPMVFERGSCHDNPDLSGPVSFRYGTERCPFSVPQRQ